MLDQNISGNNVMPGKVSYVRLGQVSSGYVTLSRVISC
jgi:hypothetical protein